MAMHIHAGKRYRLTIDTEDAKGPIGDMTDCPVARAMKRRFGGMVASVGYCRAGVKMGTAEHSGWIGFNLSEELEHAIHLAVDDSLPFETGTYYVTADR